MLLQNKAKDGALSMIKIAGLIQTAEDLLIDESDDSINVEELSKAEASRIQALFIQQIFENTISEENPQLEYSYEVDSKASIKKVRELLDENIADYFYNNYYAMPVICYEGSTITLKVEETNRFISILDTQLVTELRNFIEKRNNWIIYKGSSCLGIKSLRLRRIVYSFYKGIQILKIGV